MATLSPQGSARPLGPVIERAQQLLQQNAAGEARQLCLSILELAPAQLDALTMLHQICKQKDLPVVAEALLRRIVALHPNTFWAVNDLALLTLGKGAIFEAETHARNAIRLAPENPQSHYLMGMVMTESNRPKVGEYHYQKVLELTGRRGRDVIVNLAQVTEPLYDRSRYRYRHYINHLKPAIEILEPVIARLGYSV